MSKKKAVFISYFPEDFLTGTDLMGPWEELAYRRICDYIYKTDDRLKDDDQLLARITKTGRRWKAIRAALFSDAFGDAKLEVIDGVISNLRCRVQLTKAHDLIQQKVDAGNASAKARNKSNKSLKDNNIEGTDVSTSEQTNDPTNDITNVGGLVEEKQALKANETSTTLHTTSSKEPPISPKGEDQDLFQKTPPSKPNRGRKPDQEDPEFEKFKAAYPSRIGAQGWPEASRNFQKLVKSGTSPEILIRAAQNYNQSTIDKSADERQFIMQAASFLGPRKQAWKEFMNGAAVNGHAVSRETRRVDPGTWDGRVEAFRDQGLWNPAWGPKPTEPGCNAPAEVLQQFERRQEA